MLNNQAKVPTWSRMNHTPTQKVTVNNRFMGERGALSGGFGTHSTTTREKLRLRHMMAKTKSETYANNPIEQRRMQQKIAVQAGQLYGIDSQMLMARNMSRNVAGTGMMKANTSDNYGLREKMKAVNK
ncbi:hypothetical protein IJJ27_02900 [bacterium]|nr:hypothetical protein [bacterium]